MERRQTIPARDLSQFAKQVLMAVGVSQAESALIADSLVFANLTGVDSHGLGRLKVYTERFTEGYISANADMKWVVETPALAVLDAANGWGQTAAKRAMDKAVEMARSAGTATVLVRNSNHIGTCAYWTLRAARQMCVGFASTNAPAVVSAWGAATPTLGTNPLSIAVPTSVDGTQRPLVLDMATSEVARGKILEAAKAGKQIPETWALCPDGSPTTDPQVALKGSLLPFGGPKGSGLSLMLDVLTGVLSGSRFGTQVGDMYGGDTLGVGHVFSAIHIPAIMDAEGFCRRIQERCQMTTKGPSVPGQTRIYLPGGREEEIYEERCKNGIPLGEPLYEELWTLGAKHGVSLL